MPSLTPPQPTSVPATATSTLPPALIPSPSPASTGLPSTGLSFSFTHPTLTVLISNLPSPDDLAQAPDGSIYISDIQDGTVKRLTPTGSLQLVLSGLNEPEGMAFLPNGSLVIAEQGKNRLVRYDLVSKTVSLFYQLNNQTGQLGVDGIALDGHEKGHESLIVPDSPNGTILRFSLDGKQVETIASGLSRPTGAWVESNGSILVTDENADSLLRIQPDGSREILAGFSIPDDVIVDPAGNIFVVSIGDHALHVIPAGTRLEMIVTGDFSDPQGLTFSQKGTIFVTDPGNHRLVKVTFDK